MGFSSYTDFGVPQYGDLGPPEPWYTRAIREQGEQIGKLQDRVSELEYTLQSIQMEMEEQRKVIERLQPRPWRG